MKAKTDDEKIAQIKEILSVALQQFGVGRATSLFATGYLSTKRKECLYIYDRAIEILER